MVASVCSDILKKRRKNTHIHIVFNCWLESLIPFELIIFYVSNNFDLGCEWKPEVSSLPAHLLVGCFWVLHFSSSYGFQYYIGDVKLIGHQVILMTNEDHYNMGGPPQLDSRAFIIQ